MVFIGYESGSKAYRVFDPVTGRVHVLRDVVFDEDAGWDWSRDGDAPVDSTFTMEYFALSHTNARTHGTTGGAAGAATGALGRAPGVAHGRGAGGTCRTRKGPVPHPAELPGHVA